MRKIKKITKVEDIEFSDEDEVAFFLQYEPEMTQVMLTVVSQKSMTPHDVMDAIASFVNDASEFPDTLFVESIDSNEHLH
jgi:hypothetical protein